MKKILTIILVTLLMALFTTPAMSKIDDFEIEFTIDAEFAEFVNSYKVYTEVPGTNTFEHIATFDASAGFIYQMTAIDLQPGKTTNFYLAAVYGTDPATAIEDRSTAHPYKYTGKPVVIRINKL